MRKTFFIIIFSLLFIFINNNIFAVPASPAPFIVRQADGTEVTIRLHGDEFFSYATSEEGFLVTQNAANQWVFAKIDNNKNIVATAELARAKRFLTENKLKYINEINQNINPANIRAERIALRKNTIELTQRAAPISGTIKALVILVNFKDKAFVVPNPQQAFSNLLNQQNYSANNGTGSARDYFIDNSSGAFTPQFDVFGPYNLPENMSYYGSNDSNGYDQNPEEMVRQACLLAYGAGVDFKQYDSDKNNVVDQVFIYYAGNNEAEGAPSYTIWPHRSRITNLVLDNGMRVRDYACASELRSTYPTADYMCGIGTFVHEFGHILNLPDLYNPNGDYTLGDWDVMDVGCYLNSGRTPAGYSAYERFYVGWLTPQVINSPEDVILNPLNTSNTALLVSETGTSNLNGTNPAPQLFYLLENRQKKNWDAFLPASGLMITKIKFNPSRWSSNNVNTDSANMGVDIMEADGIADYKTMNNDLFPTGKTDSFDIVFQNAGTTPLTKIQNTNNIITFKFMGGAIAATTQPQCFIENDNFVIETLNFDNQKISIFNLEGKQIYDGNFIRYFTINKSQFPRGIYIVKVGEFKRKFLF